MDHPALHQSQAASQPEPWKTTLMCQIASRQKHQQQVFIPPITQTNLTHTDLAVPRSPIIRTPPMLRSMTLRSSASFIWSCPTIFVNGKAGFRCAFWLTEISTGLSAAEQTNRLLTERMMHGRRIPRGRVRSPAMACLHAASGVSAANMPVASGCTVTETSATAE